MTEAELTAVLVKGNPTIETLCNMTEKGFYIVIEDGCISEIVPEVKI